MYYAQGEYDEALVWHFKDLAIGEKVLSKEHPDTAAIYNNIANVYDAQGKYGKALELYIKAYRIVLTVFEQEHPDTKMYRRNMEKTYKRAMRKQPFEQWLAEQMK